MPNAPFAYCVIVSKFIKSSIFIFDNISAILFMSIFLKNESSGMFSKLAIVVL